MSVSNPQDEIEEINSFPQFDVVSDTSDHLYANSNFSPDCPKYVHKKIMNEWKMLGENLPPTIFVRVNENRIDLMRAAVIGAAGTPYHDGLYFFDIAFPHDYPTRPPFVRYHSHGLQINPNLYPGGKVCLSLLNTWFGEEAATWNPRESTILQVLVSIQALVLNEKPYFNEPLRFFRVGEKYSNIYNEEVLVLCCQTTLHTLRSPPKNFESLVIKHFKERGPVILKACVAYVGNRAKVGYYGCEGSSYCEVSRKFKKSMMNLVPRMVDAFTRNGGSELETFVEQMKTVLWDESSRRVVVKKKKTNGGFVMGFFGMVKKVLGLKRGEKNGSGDKKNSDKA